nr:unnamed protein product [Callosobruchus chinensis]
MLFHLPTYGKEVLLNLFNSIYNGKSSIRENWFEYIILPVLKPGKKENEANSYRPIALASCVLKTYERLIKNRLEFYMEKNHLMPLSQYGFRKGHSTQF